MEKRLLVRIAGVYLAFVLGGVVMAGESALEYPCYLLDAYDADGGCWTGMDAQGRYEGPIRVVPEQWLVGPPPSEKSGVTLPPDHWVEVQFRGPIIDGPGDDVVLIELGPVSEQARVFITDGARHEYLLGLATAGSAGMGVDPTEIGFDISGISLPFVPRAVRILGIDSGGQAPGFDVANVRARIGTDCGVAACNPVPVDGAGSVSTDAVLSWSPGYSAEGHIVYLGTGPSDLDIDIPAGGEPQEADTFDPGGLEFGTTYYWRVDEVNDPRIWPGDVWSFTTTDHLVVDDFEAYRTSDEDDSNSTWVYEAWIGPGIYLATDQTHGCSKKAMAFPFSYYQTSTYSEAVRTFGVPHDWTNAGFKVLELFFFGGEQNSTAQMYLALHDGTNERLVLYPGDANDIRKTAWQPWRIELHDLNDIDLSHIRSIAIGFASETADPYSSGGGTVLFDDIGLYSSRCLEENIPAVDLNADCLIDLRDLDEMALDWLEKGHNVYPAATPRAPLAWYKFDGDTSDSAGTAHGQPRGSPTYAQGVYGQAIRLDGYKDAVEIAGAASLFSRITTGITIAFWQYGTDSPHHTDTLCCSNYAYGLEGPAIAINLGCWKQPGKYNWDCGRPWSFAGRLSGNHRYRSEWSGRWNHWAFTKDALAGEMKVFLNGRLHSRRGGANLPISGITSFEIGSGWYGGYDGLIDDFRIYGYALSQPEIVHVATGGTGIFDLPLLVPADLNGDNRIDFSDFARLAEHWLENRLWP
ncbi:MAG TPA: LamG-like jellyroll fold domain-containing protein [Sedimentisphaerales bacterium]|nr:LamG-like jellyroll fold domain-containing protein [Sedimentisphaerales bacterium]